MFRIGLLKTEEPDNISVVKSEEEKEQRIASMPTLEDDMMFKTESNILLEQLKSKNDSVF